MAFAPVGRCGPELHASRPASGDQSATALRAYQARLVRCHGGHAYHVPLAVKAEHYVWMLWRYHLAPHRQVMPRITLPARPGEPVVYEAGADVSTWNGALLAALAHAWAATRDPAQMERIVALLEGMHLFLRVTGVPGLPARYVLPSETPVGKAVHLWLAPDGTRLFYRDEPAKGTVNQLVLGYATLLALAGPDLPEAARQRARSDLGALVMHLVRNDWRLTRADGRATRYGDLRPLVFGVPLPFNAQVATMIAAAGRHFPPPDPEDRGLARAAWDELRRREPWYRSPWRPPFYTPQGVGRSRFLSVNDLNHLANATFTALFLELDAARREQRKPDRELVAGLARTLEGSEERLLAVRNALGALMWAALLREETVREALGVDADDAGRRVARLLAMSVEQLRRFPVDRFRHEGFQTRVAEVQWVDAYRPDSYHWKTRPRLVWLATGPPTRLLTSAIDYLHAYWLLRSLSLERHPSLSARHFPVLEPR